jgi:hypothetical protein
MRGGSGVSGVLAPDLTLGGPWCVHYPLSGSLWDALERDGVSGLTTLLAV